MYAALLISKAAELSKQKKMLKFKCSILEVLLTSMHTLHWVTLESLRNVSKW